MGTYPQDRPKPSIARSERFRRQRRQIDEATRQVNEEIMREHVDNRAEPPQISPPIGRILKVRRKYPPIKGGAVTGRRTGGNTA